MTMLEAVYVDAREERRIVAIKPKAPFRPIFQIATMKEGSGIVLVHESKGEAKKRVSLHPVGMRLTRFRVCGGDGGGSNYTVNTGLEFCWRREIVPTL